MQIKNYIPYFHSILSILFGIFFIYVGVKKFIPKPARPNNNIEQLVQAVISDSYEKGPAFKLTVKSMKANGFLYFIGVLQLLSGLLIIWPATRFGGLLLLLPITINIFLLHLFLDDRIGEDIETGLILLGHLLLISFYYKLFGRFLIK